MANVLDTIAPTTLSATYDDTAAVRYTVEATIKSVAGLDDATLESLGAHAASTGNRKMAFVVRHAVALKAERAAAYAEAHAGSPEVITCDCGGSGKHYGRGYFENGVFRGTIGTCFRCGGKGHQTPADQARNAYYDNHVRRVYA